MGVHPKLNFELPAVPHPTPYYRLALLAATEGLLIRPVISGVSRPHAFIRIPWSDDIHPEEITYGPESPHTEANWNDAAVVYGILGCIKLTAGESTSCKIMPTIAYARNCFAFQLLDLVLATGERLLASLEAA